MTLAAQEARIKLQKRFGRSVQHAGRCTGCKGWITAQTRKQWQRLCRGPCPHCGKQGW